MWVSSREDLDANGVVTLRAQPGGVISVAPGRVTPNPTPTSYMGTLLIKTTPLAGEGSGGGARTDGRARASLQGPFPRPR